MDSSIQFSKKVRIRVCGLCLIDNKILLLQHQGLGETGTFWSPPGGGVEFGETLVQALQREFREESGLKVNVGDFLFIHEFLDGKLHAIELFFKVHHEGGDLKLGYDPELSNTKQMLSDIKLFTLEDLAEIPENQKHQILGKAGNFEELLNLRGHYKSENNSIK